MKNILPKLLFVAFLVAICFWQVWPPEEQIKLGKDLRGGVSLVYQVEMPKDSLDPQGVLAQMIDSLKRRVNPQGVLDISFQPQGDDRIEIVMPLPSPEVKALQDAYLALLDTTAARTDIRPRQLDRLLETGHATDLAPAPADGAAADANSLRDLLTRLQAGVQSSTQARQEYQSALERSAAAEELGPIEDRIAASEIQSKVLREQVLARAASTQRLKRALSLPTEAARSDAKSPRDVEIDSIKSSLPDFSVQIDALVTAHDAYSSQVTGYEDPEDLKRLLRAAGVLEFRIAVSAAAPQGVNPDDIRNQLADRGPTGTDSAVARWFPINDLKQWYETPEQLEALLSDPTEYMKARDLVGASYEGRPYLLLYTSDALSMVHSGQSQWSMVRAFRSQDELGRQSVAFQLDHAGGSMIGRLTGPNVGKAMAIVLDGQVYSAPRLQSQISGSGQITGSFTDSDVQYLVRVLEGGELEARLLPEPVSTSILGPALGRDNLLRGRDAVVYSVLATAVVMVMYYFGAGVIANIALAINVILIFGITAMVDGTFTLPGLAGVALSIAMAVDANVLIYERVREELIDNKEPLKNALRLGYARALSAIVDGNITNLIVCVVLYKVAATEVKGFALTMTIGVLTTLFTALFVTRVLFAIYTDVFKCRTLPMLPTVFPFVARLLHPRLDWMAIRWPIWVVCIGLGLASLAVVVERGRELLETEFRGGVTMTMSTRMARTGEPTGSNGGLLLSRPAVESRVRTIGEKAAPGSVASELRSANVLTVGELSGNFESTSFQIKVANPANLESSGTLTEDLVNAIGDEFAQDIDVVMPSRFTGLGVADSSKFTFPIQHQTLGANIGRPAVSDQVHDYMGGVAVVLEGIDPPVTVPAALSRIARMRSQPDFSLQAGRATEVIGLDAVNPADPSQGYRAIVVLVADPAVNLDKVDAATWSTNLADAEWSLISAAFGQKLSLDQVNSFSPRVAENLAQSAIVAVVLSLIGMLLYIWLRFSSFRYSAATIVALMFNLSICLGALSVSTLIGQSSFAASIGLEEFRIDLNVISALLTIIGYSLNDTIVILDRIRENKGKLPYASRRVVNNSINQTFSRTVLTGGSTIATAVILYYIGGTGIRPFAFTFLVGLIAGTISSVVIAAPLSYSKDADASEAKTADGHADEAMEQNTAPNQV
ncbi:MAG: protein translocase subunit SecD [Phycisphaerales bacterium]|nr:protein translocase subunit SecD [Phycisphaerales bacterium]